MFKEAKMKKHVWQEIEEKKRVEEEKTKELWWEAKKEIEQESKAWWVTDEGIPVYTEEELGMNKGGDTEDCPFDCQCCY